MHLPTLCSLAALYLTPALAFFKLPCDNPLVQERADPIISPGKVAGAFPRPPSLASMMTATE